MQFHMNGNAMIFMSFRYSVMSRVYYMWLSESCLNTNGNFYCPSYSYILQLCMLTASTEWWQLVCSSRVLLANHVNLWLVKVCQWRALNWQWGSNIASTISTCLLIAFLVEYWPIHLHIYAGSKLMQMVKSNYNQPLSICWVGCVKGNR